MLYLIKWLYMWILPLGGIVLALLAVLVYMFRHRSPGRWALLAVVIALYGLSVMPVSWLLVHPLETRYAQPDYTSVNGDVIILLGGGSLNNVPDFDGTGQLGMAASHRFLTTLRLQRSLHLPVLLSGGVVFDGDASEGAIEKRMLLSLGVDEKEIYLDEQSRNTAENARYANELCRRYGWQRPILVTSGFHMPRSVTFFQHEGLNVIPYPCDYHTSDVVRLTPFSFIPQAEILYESCLAIKEYAGIVAAHAGLQ